MIREKTRRKLILELWGTGHSEGMRRGEEMVSGAMNGPEGLSLCVT